MGGRGLTAPAAALAINAGMRPFVLAVVLATAAALPICGAEWQRGENLLEWTSLAVGIAITSAMIATPLRALAPIIALLAIPVAAGAASYELHAANGGYMEGLTDLVALSRNQATWAAAVVYASLAALAGWRRGGGDDALDRNGLFAGVWLVGVGAFLAVVATMSPAWRLADQWLNYDYNTLQSGWVGLHIAAIVAAAIAFGGGLVLAGASVFNRRRRRAFLDQVFEDRGPGWSVERGDDPTLPVFLDPSRAPSGVLVRGDGLRIARVRTPVTRPRSHDPDPSLPSARVRSPRSTR